MNIYIYNLSDPRTGDIKYDVVNIEQILADIAEQEDERTHGKR